ncbi:MAG: alanine--tRNA ligase [Candidatus Omnitrophica bacterium]|nr:alanine--tRNA ligase [Candidatus Omnitrophota bacterium]
MTENMTANQIRQKFLDFFASKGHTVIKSDSLVPKDDPTVLFTTAGMQQFKRQFLGHIDGYTRAASSQKCMRTDDLAEVGKTAFHHTFFEMLGNFSFGDYFKKDAINWAWEFLTKELGIPQEKLWVSIYKDDEEAEEIWLNEIKIPQNRFVKLGDKSNFWPSNAKADGPNGPCGPCSEIFFDYGVNDNCPDGDQCDPDCDCGRFSEVWNLVFTQFNRVDGGGLEPLPNKNIDTGMGLERLTAVLQDKKNNFDTDLFRPIISKIEGITHERRIKLSLKEKRVIADHTRAIVFAINDGIIPSNKEQGSVVKKLITICTNIFWNKGHKQPIIYRLVDAVIEVMKDFYPELNDKKSSMNFLIEKAEEAHIALLELRIPEFNKEVEQLIARGGIQTDNFKERLGALFFKYRDTHGLPLETVIEIARFNLKAEAFQQIEQDVMAVYERKMTEQQNRSRAASKITDDVFIKTGPDLKGCKTDFTGYDSFNIDTKIARLFINDEKVSEAKKGDAVKIILEHTPFYAESGGQIGDTGTIESGNAHIKISNTLKMDNVIIHIGEVEDGAFKTGQAVTAKVNSERRLSIMRNHTATHLLQAALREILGLHVQQQGSLVAEDRLRFDFTHPQAVTRQQIKDIENYVNSCVLKCLEVSKNQMSFDKAKEDGALAFFAEKYDQDVRVVAIDGHSKELCGGTHLNWTGEIGIFKIINESAVAQGIRRIEAKTGKGAIDLINSNEDELLHISQTLKAPVDQIEGRVKMQAGRIKELEKTNEKLQFDTIRNNIETIIDKAETVGKTKLIAHSFTGIEMGQLRRIADLLKQKNTSVVAVLGARSDENAYLLVTASDDVVKNNFKANEIINTVAPLFNGSGGGKPQLAQAGSKESKNINQAVNEAARLVKDKLNS